MKYKRKSSMMVRLAALLVVAMMFTMCFVGGTFAKYTSSAIGTDTAAVAKWSIKVNDNDIATKEWFTFDLFNTIKESDTETDERNIATPDNATLIAPGTGGKFSIKIENKSEVDATYAINYSATNDNSIPVEFSTGNGVWSKQINDLNVSNKAINMNDTDTVTVYWRWKFSVDSGGDTVDTALGAGGVVPGIQVTATVTATQVD